MDKDKFLDLMKNLQTIMKCPSCGALYEVDEIQYMGSKDGYFLLSMTCSKCSLPVWVNLFSGAGTARPITDLTISDMSLSQKAPITSDEVIAFCQSLKSFRGDFKKAVGPISGR